MPYTIEIKRELPDQFFRDIMVTMVESGYHSIHYWGKVRNIDRDSDLSVVSITIREGTEDEPVDDAAEATIGILNVAAAIQGLLRGNYNVSDEIIDYIERGVRDADAGDIDAIAADVIAQIVLLDEVRYG